MTYILGISAYYHDSAAALLADGKIIAATQEVNLFKPLLITCYKKE